jgi:HAD superfamily hydrolase (TIGR01450 family)
MRLAFVTNNAARPAAAVATHLTELGIAAEPAEVVTSAQAAAHYLADRLPAGAAVLVVGTTGLEEALRERGLVPVATAGDEVAAVVQGYSPELSWRQLAEGAVAINRGVPWIATNLDPTVPSPRGRLPGNGSLVAALRHATGAEPIATGKPDPTMHRESVQRSGAENPIVVGDRLDTDIEGANAVGCASMLVLTGVTSPAELLLARAELRPTYVAADLGGLLVPHTQPLIESGTAVCGGWRASRGSHGLTLERHTGAGERDADDSQVADDLDALRALCAARWSDGGEATTAVRAGGADDEQRRTAATLLERLGLGEAVSG